MFNYNYIVDLSYVIFYSAHSAFNTYQHQFSLSPSQMGPNFDPTTDEEFNYIYKEAIEHNILNPAQAVYPFIDKSKFILCLDCARKNIWRRDIYPDYKMNRDTKDTSKDKFSIRSVFQYAHNIIVPQIIGDFNCIKVVCGCAEGDDVIAVLTKKLLEENENNKVVIISSDRDMVQLCQDRLTLITAQCKVRNPKEDLAKMLGQKEDEMDEVDSKDFLLFKIILGDPSDNIPHIKPGVGPKKAYKLSKDRKLLKETLLEDKTISDSFLRNKQLISMNEIPKDVCNMILEEYNNAIEARNHESI